jgi:hypothetical protein
MGYGVIKRFKVKVGFGNLKKLLQNSIQRGKILYDRVFLMIYYLLYF